MFAAAVSAPAVALYTHYAVFIEKKQL